MANRPTRTISVDRISNSGNPVAESRHRGKIIHVPAGNPGDELEVRLVDKGSHYLAQVIDPTTGSTPQAPRTNPRTPADESPDLAHIAEKYCGDQALPVETRHSESDLKPNEYPGSEKRQTIAQRHD